MAEPRKIAVVRLGAMGDILFTTPAVRALKRRYPDAEITYILVKKWRFLLQRNPHVTRVAGIAYREPKALGRLAREHFDLVVNLHEFEDGARICEALDADERRGHRFIDGRLVPDENSELLIKDKPTLMRLYREGVHYPALYCRIAGAPTDDYSYDFAPGPWTRRRAERFVRRNRLEAPIALHIDSRGMPTKRWSNASVRHVVRALPEHRFVLIGYRPDRTAARELESEPNLLASYHDISTQAEIIRASRLFVGIDSGPRQIAAAMGTPVVALYGPRPKELLPDFPNELSLSIETDCAPCFAEECPRAVHCMDQLAPERIVDAIREMLGRGGRR